MNGVEGCAEQTAGNSRPTRPANLRCAADFLAFPHQFVADNVEPVLFTGRVAVESDARTFDPPLRTFAPADEQLAVGAKLKAKSFARPLCPDKRAFIERARLGDGLSSVWFGRAGVPRSSIRRGHRPACIHRRCM